jgi:hypothetical protein
MSKKDEFFNALMWAIRKLTSGRFILTIMAGVGLLMMEDTILSVLRVKAIEEGGISATEILAFATTIFVVIQSVFMSYFAKKRDWEDGINSSDGTETDSEK